jgi:hypothetical protein
LLNFLLLGLFLLSTPFVSVAHDLILLLRLFLSHTVYKTLDSVVKLCYKKTDEFKGLHHGGGSKGSWRKPANASGMD